MIALEQLGRGDRSNRPPLGDVLEFMRLMWAIDHALQKTSKSMKVALGVTGPQRLVIRVVARFPGIPAGQLAELLHLHPSTLTGIVKRLERQGLLSRRVDTRDRRRVLLGLTREGRQLDIDAEGTVEAAVRAALSTLSELKVRNAAEVLERIGHSLDRTTGADARAQHVGGAGGEAE